MMHISEVIWWILHAMWNIVVILYIKWGGGQKTRLSPPQKVGGMSPPRAPRICAHDWLTETKLRGINTTIRDRKAAVDIWHASRRVHLLTTFFTLQPTCFLIPLQVKIGRKNQDDLDVLGFVSASPLMDNIWAVAMVRSIRVKIIRTVLCKH